MSDATMKPAKSLELIAEYQHLFRCPLCSCQMKLEQRSMVCEKKHCYDIARFGYINMLTNNVQTKYDKQLFMSRRFIFNKGFFNPLVAETSKLIINSISCPDKLISIFDAGCGEGTLLSKIKEKIYRDFQIESVTAGIDISKEGIKLASKEYGDKNIWCVANLAEVPFADGKFDVVLNVLAPANYEEFQRLLSRNGIVIKVVPRKDYLREIRSSIFGQTDKEFFSNDSSVDIFKNKFRLIDSKQVKYKVKLDQMWVDPLIKMTPLCWDVRDETLSEAKDIVSGLREVTVDLTILLGDAGK